VGKQEGVRMNLTELANFYNSDKGNSYKCAHFYTQHYEKAFAKYKQQPSLSLLEIGLNRDDCSEVPSLRIYQNYFGEKARLFGFDIREEFKAFEKEGFEIFIGDQSNPADLEQCCANQYDIIVDDGSHASSHQQITLRHLWGALKPGGLYVIEDLHWQPFEESCSKTVSIARQWIDGKLEGGEHLPVEWLNTFAQEVENIELLPSASPLHPSHLTKNALLFLWKK
jgi:SAM-dependent methyltransferase